MPSRGGRRRAPSSSATSARGDRRPAERDLSEPRLEDASQKARVERLADPEAARLGALKQDAEERDEPERSGRAGENDEQRAAKRRRYRGQDENESDDSADGEERERRASGSAPS